MTPEQINAYQQLRRGKYAKLIEGREVLFKEPPDSPSYRYSEDYTLEVKA